MHGYFCLIWLEAHIFLFVHPAQEPLGGSNLSKNVTKQRCAVQNPLIAVSHQHINWWPHLKAERMKKGSGSLFVSLGQKPTVIIWFFFSFACGLHYDIYVVQGPRRARHLLFSSLFLFLVCWADIKSVIQVYLGLIERCIKKVALKKK